jgi:hypothetical protein
MMARSEVTPQEIEALLPASRVLLRSAREKKKPQPGHRPVVNKKRTAPAPPGAARTASGSTTAIAQCSRLEDGHGR